MPLESLLFSVFSSLTAQLHARAFLAAWTLHNHACSVLRAACCVHARLRARHACGVPELPVVSALYNHGHSNLQLRGGSFVFCLISAVGNAK